jgi:flagellin-like protein
MNLKIRVARTRSKKKGILQDTRAISEVIGTLIIIALILSAGSIYLAQQVPEWTKESEALHIAGVTDEFAELDSLADGVVLVAKQENVDITAAGTQPIKMKPDKVPYFGLSPGGSIIRFHSYSE